MLSDNKNVYNDVCLTTNIVKWLNVKLTSGYIILDNRF